MKPDIKQRIEQIRQGEVPEGYKKTKVGIIPREWEEKKLKEITRQNSQKVGNLKLETLSITAGKGFVNQARKFGKELSGKQYVNYTVLRKGEFAYNKGNSKKYPQGCIYMLEDREIAAVPNVFNCFAFINQHNKFFYYLFNWGFLNKQLFKLINSGVRNDGLLNLYDDDFYSCFVIIPPLPEQQKIADILTTQDKVIELKEQLLAQKQQQKKYLMQQLLTGKKRLPGFNGEWVDKILKQILSPGNKIPVDDTSKYKKITVKLNFKGLDYLKPNREMADTRPFYIRKENEIIIGKQNYFNGSIALIDKQFDGCICSNAIMSFSVYDANPYFVLKFLSQNDFLKKYQMLANGTGQKELSERDFLEFHILLPPFEEQTAIANVLSAADREIDLLRQSIEAEKQKKKALMQLLLTGIVRVNV